MSIAADKNARFCDFKCLAIVALLLIWNALLPTQAAAQLQVIVKTYPIPPIAQNPVGITSGPDGALWFTHPHWGSWGVTRITTAGVVTDFPIHYPQPSSGDGIVSGPDGALWFTAFDAIGRITTSGSTTFYPMNLPSPGLIVVGPDGALWFTERDMGTNIGRITTDGQITEYPLPPAMPHAYGLTVGSDGALWFAYDIGTDVNSIGRMTVSGQTTIFPIPMPTGAIWAATLGLHAGPDGNLWFVEAPEFFDERIFRMTTSGVFTEYQFPQSGYSLQDMVPGPDGAMWFLAYPNAVGRITMSGALSLIAPTSFLGYARAITAGPDGNLWFTGYPGGGPEVIGEIVLSGSSPLTTASLSGPSGNNGWYLGTVTVALSSVEPGGTIASTYFSVDSSANQTYAGPFPISGDGVHQLSFFSADSLGNQEKPHTQTIRIDTKPPVSRVAALPAATPTPFNVRWSGIDTGSGLQNFTVYVSDNGGVFVPWLSATQATQANYPGSCGHRYGFYSIATDVAGNSEFPKTSAESVTSTSVPASIVSHVGSLPAMTASPNFSVQWSGSATCGAIRAYDIYVSDSGGTFTLWLAQTALTHAYFVGSVGHTYGFYSIATDNAGAREGAKTIADATTQVPAQMAADVNRDGRIDCADVSVVKAALGGKVGQPGFDARADVNSDGIVDIRDLAAVTQKLIPGTVCP